MLNILSKEFTVVKAMNGYEALAELRKALPDIVLLDGMMVFAAFAELIDFSARDERNRGSPGD